MWTLRGRFEAALGFALALAGLCASAAAAEDAPATDPLDALLERRAPCANRDPERRPYFGDLHVHTAFSQDAATQGTRNRPRDAYAFARGEPLGLQPYDADGKPLRTARLRRPLDFAAVTDHAEQFGEVHICSTPGQQGHGSLVCRLFRSWPRLAFFYMNWVATGSESRHRFCGPNGAVCLKAARSVWGDIQAAAAFSYDRSAACSFTSFVAYEWTASEGLGKNLHRNVIFRNAHVPALPVSAFEARTPARLWERLDEECTKGMPGCAFLAIPHNSNLSANLMFTSGREVGAPIDAEEAAERSRYEPLIEVMQHKGDSECVAGGADEWCAFEKLPYDRFGAKFASWAVDVEPLRPEGTVRWALAEGLRLEQQLGHNPFRFGMLASTDSHLGTPGLAAEDEHPGHGGAGAAASTALPPGLPDDLEMSPGGLAVLWAEENSRDSLFDAMLRREAYGTSGTRPVVRFFGGWSYPEDLCASPDFVRQGYAAGVPMGGELPERRGADAPTFAVSALMDAGSPDAPGTPLQRIQIVKGWVEDGQTREQVFDVAGGDNGADVDLATCEPRGEGAASLCSVWSDPGFDPTRPAFYYVRVLENPTCRWSQRLCIAAGVDCADAASVGEGFEGCCSDAHRPRIQERAWTSPIWYQPAGDGGG